MAANISAIDSLFQVTSVHLSTATETTPTMAATAFKGKPLEMADLTAIEHSTLKVPYEVLNKRFRVTQKTIEREVFHITTAVGELERVLISDARDASQISSLLSGLLEKLSTFKRKAEEVLAEEVESGRMVKRRLDHLKERDQQDPLLLSQWRRTRLDRLLVEYLLRMGSYTTARKLAETRKIEHLTNLDIFIVANEVEESLNKCDTSKCLAWCHENKTKLRKLNSSLEFNIRLQEFIELIKVDRRMDAVWHARKYFTNQDMNQLPAIQRCMALLAFPIGTAVTPYKELLSEDRWKELILQFREENLNLFQLSAQSAFGVVLQAGLSALKTAQCYRRDGGTNPDCPVCQKPLNDLASPLPYAHCSQSRLVCYLTGEQLNENNQPLMLPNGYVYGQKALQEMADENKGLIFCPRSRMTYNITEAEKVYVM